MNKILLIGLILCKWALSAEPKNEDESIVFKQHYGTESLGRI